MAIKKNRQQAAKPRLVSDMGIVTDPADPQSWLYLNPQGASASGLVFGVLRKTYADRANTAVAFGKCKLAPVRADPGGDPDAWPVTAERVDVVLPDDADDALADPRALLTAMDANAIDKALLVYVTLPFPEVGKLHLAWESARTFARTLSRERQLASVVVLHAPGRVASPNATHAHLLICPRKAGPLGISLSVYDDELIRDHGQSVIEELWREHLAAG